MKQLFLLRNRTGNFSPSPPGASANETTISLSAIEEENFLLPLQKLQQMKRLLLLRNRTGKFSPPPPRASANETTLTLAQ